MKITINIDCTPAEARQYMGLADVAPMQEAMLKELQERMMANVTSLQPAEMIKAWIPPGLDNWLDALKPDDAKTLNQLAWNFATAPDPQLRDPERAIELANKAVRQAPNDGNIFNTLGVAQYRTGQWQLAIEALHKSMELRKGGDSYDWFFLAMALEKLGHHDEARQWYDKGVEWTKTNAPKNEVLLRFQEEALKTLGALEWKSSIQ